MFFVSAVIWQSQQAAMYTEQFVFSSETIIPTPQQLAAERKLLRAEVPAIMMSYTSLWIIKVSFLVFFRRLGRDFRGQKIWWWCLMGFTIATWATCIGRMDFKCLLRSFSTQDLSWLYMSNNIELTVCKFFSFVQPPAYSLTDT